MAEIISTKSGTRAVYTEQPTPHLRNREEKDVFRERSRQNKHTLRHLKEIKAGPPSTFHAPNGRSSLNDGARSHQPPKQPVAEEEDEKEQLGERKEARPVVPTWPPHMPIPAHKDIIRTREQRAIDIENVRIQKKLTELYRSKTITAHGEVKEMGPTIDCNDRWSKRSSVYQPSSQPSGSATLRPGSSRPAASPPQRPYSAPRATSSLSQGIPKSMQVAMCAGCGQKSFRKADGPGMMPCEGCGKVFYCSDTCRKTDLQSHKAVCKFQSTGFWQPYGRRPEDDYWVNNAAMAEARRELKERKSLNQKMSYEDELEEQARMDEVIKVAKAKEKVAMAKQAKIEYNAYWGLDGPRPCLYSAGKKV